MKFFSTFTGIGGFEIGIQNAYRSAIGGVETHSQGEQQAWERLFAASGQDTRATDGRSSERTTDLTDQRPLCVGYSEIDKYAASVYEHNFPGAINYGDITKINEKDLPDFDCLVGGFPCQAFSIAGKRRGFKDTRGTLFFDLARILREKQPRYFVFENVKGLLSHDDGNTFRTIITATDELGYDVQWQVLNSKNHGVPQNRERVYIVGHLRGERRPEVFPIVGTNEPDTIIRTIRTGGARSYTEKHARDIVKIGTLRTHKDGNGFREVKSGVSPTIPARAREDGSGQPVMTDGLRIRRLTPVECERLQGFPDGWTELGVLPNWTDPSLDWYEVSDTQRYKMLGNAVTTNVVQAVFERIFAESPSLL